MNIFVIAAYKDYQITWMYYHAAKICHSQLFPLVGLWSLFILLRWLVAISPIIISEEQLYKSITKCSLFKKQDTMTIRPFPIHVQTMAPVTRAERPDQSIMQY
uniref:Uncharacterized protein n=1 Tax=Clytia hemisphaerica TaxID=252671 RepID=A0A7M5WZS1_9CNID